MKLPGDAREAGEVLVVASGQGKVPKRLAVGASESRYRSRM